MTSRPKTPIAFTEKRRFVIARGLIPILTIVSHLPFAARAADNLPDPAFDIDPAEAALNQHYHQAARPQFHYTPIQGDLGDATGLIYYAGQYHLFYMFDRWERRRDRHKCWGHATSHDLIHWDEKEPILDPIIDHHPGSGSGIVDWNNTLGLRHGAEKTLAVFYTDYAKGSCIAYSTDAGATWIRHPRNPVLPGTEDARDPLVFWYPAGAAWRMVRYERKGFTFYSSENLLDWTELSRIEGYYECPDFFELPVEGSAGERKWVLMGADLAYRIGSFDGREFHPESEMLRVEQTRNLYAPQTWKKTIDGSQTLTQLVFLSSKKDPRLTWHCQMAFPCQLSLRKTSEGIRLCREPSEEINDLRISQQAWRDLDVRPGENPLADVHGELLDLRMDIALKNATALSVDIRGQRIRYSPKDQELTFQGVKAPAPGNSGRISLQVLVDRSSVEIFINHGEATLSRAAEFDPARQDFALQAEGDDLHVVSMQANHLESIWLKKE